MLYALAIKILSQQGFKKAFTQFIRIKVNGRPCESLKLSFPKKEKEGRDETEPF